MNWGDLAVQLNDKGYFTRHCIHDGKEALEVCHPDRDVFSHDIMRELRRQDISTILVANKRNWYVRITERSYEKA